MKKLQDDQVEYGDEEENLSLDINKDLFEVKSIKKTKAKSSVELTKKDLEVP